MKQTPEELFAGFQPDLGNKEKYMADFSILLYPSFGTDLYAKFTLGLVSIPFNKLVCVSLFLAAIPLSLYFLLPDTK